METKWVNLKFQNYPPKMVLNEVFPAVAIYGDVNTQGRYVSLVTIAGALPVVKQFFPPHAQYLPMNHLIIPDMSNTILGMFVQILTTGQTRGSDQDCQSWFELLHPLWLPVVRPQLFWVVVRHLLWWPVVRDPLWWPEVRHSRWCLVVRHNWLLLKD